MTIRINDTPYEVPFDLSQITLGKFIEYYDKHGRDLDKELEEIATCNYEKLLQEKFDTVSEEDIELHRSLDLDTHLDKEALAWFSFWTGIDLSGLQDQPMITPLLSQYRLFRHLLNDSKDEAQEFPYEMQWNSSDWKIQDYSINPASDMTFNEIITSKEVMRQVHSLGKNKWDALPYLCAVFFRKKDEAFDDMFIQEGSERLELMHQLPMSIALKVAFFLSICVHTWSNTSVYLNEAEPEIQSLS